MTAQVTGADKRLFDAIDATWTPAKMVELGRFILREGKGGGKRVSAATLIVEKADTHDIEEASNAMRAMKQPPLFMVRKGEDALDATLDALGFEIVDPTVVYTGSAEMLAIHAPKGIATIPSSFPLSIHKEVWLEDRVGPERQAVMDRVANPKAYLLGRFDERAAGTVFVAANGEIAMLHALFVRPFARNNGVGKRLTFSCARWALTQGASTLALLTTRANREACALYESIGMREVSHYHYRILTE